MRGKVAKRIRNIVYGDEYSPRHRDYNSVSTDVPRIDTGRRRIYQDMKKQYSK